tara:strand:+ start:849 stop:1112 length:264 start_codon:yes stop_codon:yes gene_type:complete
MKITKIIAAFMLAGFISIAGCDTATEVPEGGPDPAEMGTEMEAEISEMGEDPGDEAPADEAPADEAPAAEAPAEEAAEAPAAEATDE